MCIDRKFDGDACAGGVDAADALTDPATLISATLYLMSCHATSPCPKLADMIARHLGILCGTPLVPAVMRATCRELCKKWDGLALADCSAASTGTFVAGPSLTH